MIINFFNKNGGSGSGYTLPIASENTLGGVKIGSGITIDAEGHISAEGGSDPELREDIIEGRVVAGMAKQLQSPDGVSVTGSPYIMRTTAGEVSVSTGFANLNGVLANTIADEPVYESLTGEYNAIPRGPANNEIWYTTNNESAVTLNSTAGFGANFISNTYEDGKGVITFDGPINAIGQAAFHSCTGLTSITIPDSVTSIGIYAFYNCSGLVSITISDSITSIGNQSFAYCTGLTSIYCYNSVPPTLGEYVFFAIWTPIYVPAESVDAYKVASGWSDYADIIQAIPETNDLTASNDDSEDLPTITIDNAIFKAAISEVSGTYTFNYDGSAWSPVIANYGITVTGDAISGDSISVVYVAAVMPSPMQNATPTAFYATGLNSFDKGGEFSIILSEKSINAEGQIVDEEGSYVAFVKAVKDLEDGYIVYGDTGVIGLADSDDVESVEVVEDNDGVVMTDKDFIAITTYDLDTLCAHPRWSGYKDTDYEEFRIARFVIPSTDKDGNDLPAFAAVGNTRNEYDFAGLKYIQRVEVVPFDEELIEQLRISKTWGVDYVFDENNIHMVLDTPVAYDLAAEDNLYWVDDFGVEGFEGTEVGAVSYTWYMANLVDKLRRDVVTKDELNIDRIKAVDAFPETADLGDIISLKDYNYKVETEYIKWSSTGSTNNYTLTINHLPNLTQTLGGWEYHGGHPRLDFDAETGNFVFKVRYSGETDYDVIATIEPGSNQTDYIYFYSQTGQTGSSNRIKWNWTNATALTINFANAMTIDGGLNPVMNKYQVSNLYKYVQGPTWGKWDGCLFVEALELNNKKAILKYSYLPSTLQGVKMCEYRYQSSYYGTTLYLYFDIENEAIRVYTSEVTDFETTPFDIVYKGENKNWSFGIGSGKFEWNIDNYFVFYDSSYNCTVNRCSTHIDGFGWKEIGEEEVATTYSNTGIPTWNEYGQVVGRGINVATRTVYLNNTGYSNNMGLITTNTVPNRLFIPTQGGNQGQVLTSTGGNEPSWVNPNTITGGISFWKGTSDEYDAIATKDPNTFYIIVDE